MRTLGAISETVEEETVFIGDHDQGFGGADDEFGDYFIRAMCAYYLIDNFRTQYSRTLKPLFWRICRTNSKGRFEFPIDELREIDNLAPQYLLNSQPELCITAHFKGA